MKRKIILLLSFSFLLLGGYMMCSYYPPQSEKEIAQILGLDTADILSFYYAESWTHKDYDIVEVYQLSEATINDFIENSTFILYDESYEKKAWGKTDWQRTPINMPDWDVIYSTAITPRRQHSKHNEWMLQVQRTLEELGNFCSFYYREGLSSVAIYVLDINGHKLYCVYFKV